MLHDPILHMLGLARKAGRLELGEEPVGALCRSRHARLILLASNAAPNTFRRAAHFGEAGNVLWLTLPHTKEELGFFFGRSTCAILALSDAGMAASLVDKLAKMDPVRYGPAAQQLQEKADRMLQRQREKRQHEKNLRQGKKKPWAPPPPPAHEPPPSRPGMHGGSRPNSSKPGYRASGHSGPHAPKPPQAGRTAPDFSHGRGSAHSGSSFKPGPGGRKLSGKFRHNP